MFNTKDGFLERLDWEMNKTIQVFSSLPADQIDYKPHENSRSAKELMATVIGEEALNKDIIDGQLDFSKIQTDYGSGLEEIISRAKASHMEVMDKLKNIPEEQFNQNVDWMGRQESRLHAMRELMFDQVHHRGQFSVYLRLTGGKVPAIYGPSFDEPL